MSINELYYWKELLILLDGNEECGLKAASLISDCSNDLNVIDIISEIINCKLFNNDWRSRENASIALQLIFEKHKEMFLITINKGNIFY